MEDFVHCNNCFILPEQKNQQFFITTCGHIFCDRCKDRASEQCLVCKTKGKVVEINRVDPRMQFMLLDLSSLSKKHNHEIQKAIAFQKMHRNRYVGALKEQLKKAKKLHEFAQSEAKKRQIAERENQKLKEELVQMKQQMARFEAAAARMVPNAPPNRHRPNVRPNDSFNAPMQMRNPPMNDTGISLPAGPSGFQNAQRGGVSFFNIDRSPYSDSSQASPSVFNFAGNSTVAGSPNTAVNPGEMYVQAWMNNSHEQQPFARPINPEMNQSGFQRQQQFQPQRISNIMAAFQGV